MKIKILMSVLSLGLLATGAVRAAADEVQSVAAYDFDQPRTTLAAIEQRARTADVAQRQAIEQEMVAVLADAKATFAAKQFACRMLRLVGSEACVESVAALLTDEKLSHMARFALQGNPSPKVDDALRAALDKTTGDVQIGIVNTIGVRGDANAVKPLAVLAAGQKDHVAEAALLALGRVGTKDAAELLAGWGPQNTAWAIASLSCAERLVAPQKTTLAHRLYRAVYGKETRLARKLYRTVYASQQKPVMKLAALRGLIAVETSAADDLPALVRSSDPVTAAAAAQLLAELPGSKTTKTIVEELPTLMPSVQVILLNNLALRGDHTVTKIVAPMTSNSNIEVSVAAIMALGELGDAGHVPLLLKLAAAGGETAPAAAASLERLRGGAVNGALIKAVTDTNSAIRVQALNALAARDAREATAALLSAGKDVDAKARSAAFKALRVLAGPEEVKPLLDMLLNSKTSADRQRIEPALASAVERCTDTAMVATLLTDALSATDEVKEDLLPVFGRLGGAQAFAAVEGQLKNGNLNLHKAAIRALADWRDAAPLAVLFAVAKNDADENCRILALRGYIQLAGLPAQRSIADSLVLYRNALEVATRPEEQMLVLAGLAEVKDAGSFKLAATCFGSSKRLNEAAANTLAQLVDTLPGQPDAGTAAALKQALSLIKDKKLKQAVEKALRLVIPKDEPKTH